MRVWVCYLTYRLQPHQSISRHTFILKKRYEIIIIIRCCSVAYPQKRKLKSIDKQKRPLKYKTYFLENISMFTLLIIIIKGIAKALIVLCLYCSSISLLQAEPSRIGLVTLTFAPHLLHLLWVWMWVWVCGCGCEGGCRCRRDLCSHRKPFRYQLIHLPTLTHKCTPADKPHPNEVGKISKFENSKQIFQFYMSGGTGSNSHVYMCIFYGDFQLFCHSFTGWTRVLKLDWLKLQTVHVWSSFLLFEPI